MKTSIHVLNVGHGDSLIVEILDGKNEYWTIIDCHNPYPPNDSPTLQFLKKRKVDHIKSVCLTHPDYDHYSGLHQLLEYYSTNGRKVDCFLDIGMDYDKYQSFINTEREENELSQLYKLVAILSDKNQIYWDPFSYEKNVIEDKTGTIVSLGPNSSDVVKYVKQVGKRIHEFKKGQKVSNVDKNMLSTILVVESDLGLSILCSDASKKNIEKSVNRWAGKRKKHNKKFKFHFVKIPHHGSKYNNHLGLWKKNVLKNQSVAAISVGNKYGLPDEEVVSTALDAGVKIYATNRGGCLRYDLPLEDYTKILKDSIKQDIPTAIKESLQDISFECIESNLLPLHGNISVIDDGSEIKVFCEYPIGPITSLQHSMDFSST